MPDWQLIQWTLVQPAELRRVWPTVRLSLDAVQAKSPEDWIAEDVYHAIKSGRAALHLANIGNEVAGVMVTTTVVAEFSGDVDLHVWIAHNLGGRDVISEGMELLRKMASACGAKRITLGSSRQGWGKRFKLVSAIYEIEQ